MQYRLIDTYLHSTEVVEMKLMLIIRKLPWKAGIDCQYFLHFDVLLVTNAVQNLNLQELSYSNESYIQRKFARSLVIMQTIYFYENHACINKNKLVGTYVLSKVELRRLFVEDNVNELLKI